MSTLACWLLDHDAMLRQRRDDDGRAIKPHTLDWECRCCGCLVGSTQLVPRWSLVATLRRQAARLRRTA